MPSKIRYLKYIFAALLFVGCVVVTGYDLLYGIPKKKCDEAHNWWLWSERKCYTPVKIWNLTGRAVVPADSPAKK